MLCLPGLGCKDYWERMRPGSPIPEIECPTCPVRLRGHGSYERYVRGELVDIRRLRCVSCGVTHALLPEDLCASQRLAMRAAWNWIPHPQRAVERSVDYPAVREPRHAVDPFCVAFEDLQWLKSHGVAWPIVNRG